MLLKSRVTFSTMKLKGVKEGGDCKLQKAHNVS